MLIPVPVPLAGDSFRGVALDKPHFVAREPLVFVFTAAGADVAVPHGLGRAPAGYFAVGRTAGITVYDGVAPSSEDLLILRATGAGTAYVLPL